MRNLIIAVLVMVSFGCITCQVRAQPTAKIKLVEWDGSKPLVDGQKIVINTAIPKEDYVFG